MLGNVLAVVSFFSVLLFFAMVVLLLLRRFGPRKCPGCSSPLSKKDIQPGCELCKRSYVQKFPLGLEDITQKIKGETRTQKKDRQKRLRSARSRTHLLMTLVLIILVLAALSPLAYFEYRRGMSIISVNDSPFEVYVTVELDYVPKGSELNVSLTITNNWDRPLPDPRYELKVFLVEQLGVFVSRDLDPKVAEPLSEPGANISLAPGDSGIVNFIYDLDGSKDGKCFLIVEIKDTNPPSELVLRTKMKVELY